MIATLDGVFEPPLLAVLALAALLTRAVAAAARAVLPQRRAETGGKA